MSVAFVNRYLRSVTDKFKAGNATEHTHRAALQQLLESLDKGLSAVNEPRRIKCGAPDFILTRGEIPLGYIEAKDIGTNLDEVEQSEQLKRYLKSLNNLILTNYLEFRWYVDGEYQRTEQLGRLIGGKIVKEQTPQERFTDFLTGFFDAEASTIAEPKELADRMAALARMTQGLLFEALNDDDKGGSLRGQLEAFRKVLLHDLTEEQFSDMYAQTICYGLFAARCSFGEGVFTRDSAVRSLPRTNPFLRGLFDYIAGANLDERIAWAVDSLAKLLHKADMSEILETFGKRTRREDPIVHFYETFLAAYDPRLREARGVYYTPEPVVSYIVRSVDHILKEDFGLGEGLADHGKVSRKDGDYHRVMILDPAVGTGTFLFNVVDHIREQIQRASAGAWKSYVSDHLLPRLFGFELLMAPYAVAHMKLGLQLAESGYDIARDDRLRIYMTNTLEEAHDLTGLPLFTQWIANEVNAAAKVKTEYPVMVVLGNPPYSGHSANMGKWIHALMRGRDLQRPELVTANYFECDGQPLGERNPKWLNDDYVKFIRFAQWRIEQTGHGVLAFITNHGYLDNPTFRGMRQALMTTFDDIYILDLHGNAKKKETTPGGLKDENVFDIQQGVAIGIFVKRNAEKTEPATVRHGDLFGLREVYDTTKDGQKRLIDGKYHWLWGHNTANTYWKTLKPQPPYYLFVPQDVRMKQEYQQGMKITEIMPTNSVGIVTARDRLTIHWTAEDCFKTVKKFISLDREDARDHFDLGKDVRDWKVELAQEDIRKSGPRRELIRKILYRPFDTRHTYYTGQTRGFICMPRPEVMQHMLGGENTALLFMRQVALNEPYSHFLVTQGLIDNRAFYSNKGIMAIAPLYLYPNGHSRSNGDWLEQQAAKAKNGGRRPNLAPEFIAALSEDLKLAFVPEGLGDLKTSVGPEAVLGYIYAILYSPAYRERYADFLRIDFPRVPLTPDKRLFFRMVTLGRRLMDLHLLREGLALTSSFPVEGDNRVVKPRYEEPKGREAGKIWINDTQYFDGVRPEVWSYLIGGYQVCPKWLKDRKGRTLDFDDIRHYRAVLAAIRETIRLQADIDAAIGKHGGWPLRD